MAKGKFESTGTRVAPSRSSTGAVKKQTKRRRKTKIWPTVVAALGALIVIGGAVLLLNNAGILHLFDVLRDDGLIAQGVSAAGVDLSGMEKEAALEALQAAGAQYNKELHLTISEKTEGETQPENAPIELVFPAAQYDAEKAYEAAYRAGRSVELAEGQAYTVDPTEFLSVDSAAVRARIREAADAIHAGQDVVQTKVNTANDRREVERTNEDGTTETATEDVQLLRITMGTPAADLQEEAVYNAVLEAYNQGEFTKTWDYTLKQPDPVDLDKLEEQFCKEPVDAVYNKSTHEIEDETPGFGFSREELEQKLADAKAGEVVEVELKEIAPAITAQDLKDSLFSDVLASVSTPHTAYWNRTRNLELSAAAVNGTIVQPGEVFSFNNTVGVRTEEKGYLPATAYVSGGASAEEIGGGVCQVASSIYYACLLADLQIIDRTEHMYAVTYVPMGMDAAIYYGSLDFKFQNNTDYPLRIDASVYGGYVNIQLVGTDEKDYKVNMTYDILETIPWEEKQVETLDVVPGTVITTAYTGYRVVTYMHKIDKATGAEISVEKVAYSTYHKRDREVAVYPQNWVPEPDPGQPVEWPMQQPDQGGSGDSGIGGDSGYVQPDDGGSAVDPVDPWTDDGFTPPPAG